MGQASREDIDTTELMEILNQLLRRGVRIPEAAGIEIGPEVDLERIAGGGTVVHSGCRIFGERTLILPGARIGTAGPATIENCQIGPGVELQGGFFKDSVFLAGSRCGPGSHVREGTILEEHASIAHTVGLKQTILFPFVTLGSLINFCDCLMAGGTGRKNHSEVGSSYIHFNFTPNQDKATASLIGDVPRGVMLNQRPIFLGGQGGMVGPLRLNYGTVVAAGTILRKDELRPNRLIYGGAGKAGNIAMRVGRYSDASRIVKNNLAYIANLIALRHWYREVRALFISVDFPETLLEGLLLVVHSAVGERMRRLEELAEKLKAAGNPALFDAWREIEEEINAQKENGGDRRLIDSFKEKMLTVIAHAGKDYIAAIKLLNPEESGLGTDWLQGIVDGTMGAALNKFKAR
jgi:UDP-N-acetylglucosamine/UDP-N-acetylgalactosamine diphosphorylase